MSGHFRGKRLLSRRGFLQAMSWTPVFFVPAALEGSLRRLALPTSDLPLPQYDFRLTPHYPAKSPLDDLLRLVDPGSDEYLTEKYAFEIKRLLDEWSVALRSGPPGAAVLSKLLDPSVRALRLVPTKEVPLRSLSGIEVWRREFAGDLLPGRDHCLAEMRHYFENFVPIDTAEFEITAIAPAAEASLSVDIRYNFVGKHKSGREQRIGQWSTRWSQDKTGAWGVLEWQAAKEIFSRASGELFVDITAQTLGQLTSYREQMSYGVDHWRTVIDGSCGIDVYGNNGIAAGDFDNDGFDDLYICQPAGLPNRLYRNRGDGTFEDATESAGVGILDATACALFADFENKGLQDLLVVSGSGPLLFLNQGNGKFALKRDAFRFEQPPQGTFTHAAVADYDHDGRLDIYFCLYSYYLGLDQYHYPAPYFDARNGPPNFLFHNEGGAVFRDRTAAAGLNIDNDRYSFACAWGDSSGRGWPDLYVANDFGRSNLYRNNGDGTFSCISTQAGVEDPGAGMSACWFDLEGDGRQDIYVANMWSAAGMRVSDQTQFQDKAGEKARAAYRRHAQGNSLYRNLGDGKFKNVSEGAGVAMGRWAWSSDSWDFDHDGHPDLYIANGYITGPDSRDLASFFWRQVVGRSPESATASPNYELGWNAINELIRSDASWSGRERNVLYLNHGDGSFSEISGVAGLDFPEDSRAFVLTDLDHDGRLEIVLKNRNAPQLRVLRNSMAELGNSIAFRMRGTTSNRDAIGAAVTVESAGRRQTKYLQAGSGFLSQHGKEVFFGVGSSEHPVRATIRWPGGLTQTFEQLPVNHRIAVEEGSAKFLATPFAKSQHRDVKSGQPHRMEPDAPTVQTWLLDPLNAPAFSLPDLQGRNCSLESLRGTFVLLVFWARSSPSSCELLSTLRQSYAKISAAGLRVLAVCIDDDEKAAEARAFAEHEAFPFPTVFATAEIAGVYNIVYRYLFDRRRDLGIPTSFLLNDDGMIAKVYQGSIDPEQFLRDLESFPRTPQERVSRALPFNGTLYQGSFQRNDFTYGVAFFQHGYLDQAAVSFKQTIAAMPESAEAHYNLGTLYLRRNALDDAQQYLEQAVKLRPDYPEAWNNLGMLAAQQGSPEKAIQNFNQSLQLRPGYVVALLNLGNLYRRQKMFDEAEKLLERAQQLQPEDPEVNYSLGMLYLQQNDAARGSEYLEKAIALRPDYADALNNLGVLFVRQQRYPEAEEKFKACIQASPNFDQGYLNLARLYVILNEKQRAKDVLQALLRRQPQHKMAQQALEMLD